MARRTALLLALPLALLLSAVGCASKGAGVGAPRDAAWGWAWRPAPVAMRVYPATRFATEAGQPILELRIELFDAMSDSIKGVGRMRFELFAGSIRDQPQLARRLYRWDVDLLSLADQKRYWDPVTRAYLFRLKIDDLAIARRATVLEATFMPIEGRRIETRASITQREEPG